ncbi:ABC transporter ATP-binding protein [Candidatus Soleaferrea massiliensis]|uniref:ABC transporter ATP-binding protein n=1 Tax=Candidatus Soleaferrea massiliensis TaxID=1470354 RepID=UPI00058BB5E5|nr:ABC transporter ATP-binding protein [Candidatus Soleaferrea massiliensis]
MSVIKVEHLTKDYGMNKGVFDVSFEIEKGEVFGFLGPNGAGKTTTIRHILGFSRPQDGRCEVDGMDCWKKPDKILKQLGYLPGEIAFPNDMKGIQFIRFMARMQGMSGLGRAEELIKRFELDPSGSLKRMSKGMKQKIGIVCAFMHNPSILVLDEPTSGLDPLMQNVFVELIEEEKKAGKTILMSSHIFEEVEKTCDRVAMIRQGRIAATLQMDEIEHNKKKVFKLEFLQIEDYQRFLREQLDFQAADEGKKQVWVRVKDKDINAFIKVLANYPLKFLSEVKSTLEDYFMNFYGGDSNVQ